MRAPDPGRTRGTWRTAVAAAALTVAVSPVARAQAVPASSLKAAFLLNFAKFAEWPALERDAPITLCVAADDIVADALAATVKGQTIETHPIRVMRLDSDAAGRGCQVLFIGVRESPRLTVWLEQATARPILTVSDTEGFAASGGAIEFFVEGGRMRFAVNVDAAQRSRVRLSSRLLGLAKIVRDSHAP